MSVAVLLDHMKSVVGGAIRFGLLEDYEVFMDTLGFETKFCEPWHQFIKEKIEQMMKFVENGFLSN